MKTEKVSIITNFLLVAVLALVTMFALLPTNAQITSSSEPIRKGNSSGVSLMFNVYWGSEEIEDILSVLEEYGAKCTFFIGGSWADDNTKTLKQIVMKGHELGNHGYFHKDHSSISLKENKEEIVLCNTLIKKICGVSVNLFAPPSGAYSEDTKKVVDELKMKMILWSKDTIDWRDKNEDKTVERAIEAGEGDLVLMHPMEHTAAALKRILENYKSRNLKVITVSENIVGGV